MDGRVSAISVVLEARSSLIAEIVVDEAVADSSAASGRSPVSVAFSGVRWKRPRGR